MSARDVRTERNRIQVAAHPLANDAAFQAGMDRRYVWRVTKEPFKKPDTLPSRENETPYLLGKTRHPTF